MKISILGGGNVAYHLAKQIYLNPKLELKQIYNRSVLTHHFDAIHTEKINNLTDLKPADLYLLCVKDEAILSLSEGIPFENQLVVHMSGNTDMQTLHAKHRRGVVYPVQTFSKETDLEFSDISFCLETENEEDMPILKEFVTFLGSKSYEMNSFQRKFLHISAVFLNNFSNHIFYLSEKICKEQKIPFEILTPLLSETFKKTQEIPFFEAQTGPARRNDLATINTHLSLLQGTEKEIYKLLTNSILNTYGEKL